MKVLVVTHVDGFDGWVGIKEEFTELEEFTLDAIYQYLHDKNKEEEFLSFINGEVTPESIEAFYTSISKPSILPHIISLTGEEGGLLFIKMV